MIALALQDIQDVASNVPDGTWPWIVSVALLAISVLFTYLWRTTSGRLDDAKLEKANCEARAAAAAKKADDAAAEAARELQKERDKREFVQYQLDILKAKGP